MHRSRTSTLVCSGCDEFSSWQSVRQMSSTLSARENARYRERRRGSGVALSQATTSALTFFWITAFLVLLSPAITDVVNGFITKSNGCRIIGVVDGDTVVLACADSFRNRGRMIGFDTPELFSPKCSFELWRAFQAKWYVRWTLWNAESISVRKRGIDRYDRALVDVIVDGRKLSRSVIAAGLGRVYSGGVRKSWCD